MTYQVPQPNIPLLRKAVEFVEASAAAHGDDPNELYDSEGLGTVWQQATWAELVNHELAERQFYTTGTIDLEACGTAYCVAGYVCSLQPGYQAVFNPLDSGLRETINGQQVVHRAVATEALGLTYSQGEALFNGANSREDVRRIAEQIAGEPL